MTLRRIFRDEVDFMMKTVVSYKDENRGLRRNIEHLRRLLVQQECVFTAFTDHFTGMPEVMDTNFKPKSQLKSSMIVNDIALEEMNSDDDLMSNTDSMPSVGSERNKIKKPVTGKSPPNRKKRGTISSVYQLGNDALKFLKGMK